MKKFSLEPIFEGFFNPIELAPRAGRVVVVAGERLVQPTAEAAGEGAVPPPAPRAAARRGRDSGRHRRSIARE